MKIDEIWTEQRLEATKSPIAHDTFKLKRIDPDFRFNFFAGIDSSMLALIAVGTSSRPPTIELESSSLDYFRRQRQDSSWLLVLRLRDTALEPVFVRLCQDLLEAASNVQGEKELIALLRVRLELWARLFRNSKDGLLARHQIKGIIAELLTLEELVDNRESDFVSVVSGWTGPLKADQDFMYSARAIEVKAISPGAKGVSISSLGQLSASVPIDLRIDTLADSTVGLDGSISLVDVVLRIEQKISAVPDALQIFRDRLAETGYVEHPYYETITFSVQRRSQFRVEDGFPKLTRADVSEYIVSASYVISLDAIQKFTTS